MIHILHMIDIALKIKHISQNISDQHVTSIWFVSIPESYNNLISTLEAKDKTLITADLVKMKLTYECNRRPK